MPEGTAPQRAESELTLVQGSTPPSSPGPRRHGTLDHELQSSAEEILARCPRYGTGASDVMNDLTTWLDCIGSGYWYSARYDTSFEHIVVLTLYVQSGAGKSSLINAAFGVDTAVSHIIAEPRLTLMGHPAARLS
jgi:hypothetical protein